VILKTESVNDFTEDFFNQQNDVYPWWLQSDFIIASIYSKEKIVGFQETNIDMSKIEGDFAQTPNLFNLGNL